MVPPNSLERGFTVVEWLSWSLVRIGVIVVYSEPKDPLPKALANHLTTTTSPKWGCWLWSIAPAFAFGCWRHQLPSLSTIAKNLIWQTYRIKHTTIVAVRFPLLLVPSERSTTLLLIENQNRSISGKKCAVNPPSTRQATQCPFSAHSFVD